MYSDLSITSNYGDYIMIKDILYEQIRSYGINFKYWVTINWRYKQLNELQVSKRHKGLRRLLRHFYKEPIRCWFFNEIHTRTASPHCGGFHTHALIEDCSPTRWKHPPQRMERFLQERGSEVLFSALSGDPPSDEEKKSLLTRVLRLHSDTPNGWNGVDVQMIYDLDGLIGDYCTKQIGDDRSIAEVIDVAASDLTFSGIRDYGKESVS